MRVIGRGGHYLYVTRFLLSLFVAALISLAANVPKGPPPGDAVIEATLRTKLAKSKIGADHFKFRVQGGVVYWDGTTDVVQHKGAATRMAKSAGAKRVVNQIQISQAGKAKARAYLDRDRREVKVDRQSGRTEPRTAPRATVIRR